MSIRKKRMNIEKHNSKIMNMIRMKKHVNYNFDEKNENDDNLNKQVIRMLRMINEKRT